MQLLTLFSFPSAVQNPKADTSPQLSERILSSTPIEGHLANAAALGMLCIRFPALCSIRHI
jgi:hypothetical protein